MPPAGGDTRTIASRVFSYLLRLFRTPNNQLDSAAPHSYAAHPSATDGVFGIGTAPQKHTTLPSPPVTESQPTATTLKSAVQAAKLTAATPESGTTAASSNNTTEGTSVKERVTPLMAQTLTTKVLKAVKPHVPLIKFGRAQPPPTTATTSSSGFRPTPTVPPSVPPVATVTLAAAPKPVVLERPTVGTTERGTGIDDSLLPAHLRRRLIDEEEIEAINMGGCYRGS